MGRPDAVKAALLEFFPDLVDTYGSTSAVLGADFYDMLRDVPPSAASFRAASAQPAKPAQAEGSVRWAIGALYDSTPNPALLTSNLMGSTQRLVWQPFRETVFTSASSDPVRTGVARVPTGPATCQFCVMLASRGAVYKSKLTAGDESKFHDDCDCMPTVVRTRDDYPDDFDLGLYKSLYAESAGIGRDLPAT